MAPGSARLLTKSMYIQITMEVETITFTKGTQVATVVTNGERTHTYEDTGRKVHKKLSTAIAYLECRGYSIYIE